MKDQPQDDLEVRISKDLKIIIITVLKDERKNTLINEKNKFQQRKKQNYEQSNGPSKTEKYLLKISLDALNSCCCSVAKMCPILCYPMDCSTPGFPVLQYLPVCLNSGPLSW